MVRGVNRLGRVAGLWVVVLAGPGCATVATGGGGDQTVTITSTPPGAAVAVDGKPYGSTPAKVSLSRRSEHQVELSAAGYETAHVTLRSRLNPWLLGNLVVGGPFGLILDVITDASYRLTPTELEVDLRGVAAPPPQPASPAEATVPAVPKPPV